MQRELLQSTNATREWDGAPSNLFVRSRPCVWFALDFQPGAPRAFSFTGKLHHPVYGFVLSLGCELERFPAALLTNGDIALTCGRFYLRNCKLRGQVDPERVRGGGNS